MVLNAHRPTNEALGKGEISPEEFDSGYCERAERDLDGWYIPTAVSRFAEVLVRESNSTPACVITTNFDPLIQVAVRRAGGVAVTKVLDVDGKIEDLDVPEGVVVTHLHGFWRLHDTYHLPHELRSAQRGLQASLEDLLRERTMIVTGYGGWDDAFTTALVDAVQLHRAGDLDVVWTFFDDDWETIFRAHEDLIERVGYVAGRVSFYLGIDCGFVFDSMLAEDPRREADRDDFFSPLEGFTAVTPTLLERQGSADEAELIRFFDGQMPTWPSALSERVPRLGAVQRVAEAIEEGVRADELSVALLLGPAGEGKSTVLRQIAGDRGRLAGWRVVWREMGADASLDPSKLERGDWKWLVVIDDADVVADACLAALRALHEMGRTDVCFVLASRTSDWRSQRASSLPWASYSRFASFTLDGLAEDDAMAIVSAWSSAGSAGLGSLASEPSPDGRASALLRAARDEAPGYEGSFFGAMLRVRFGEGLRDHVRILGERLRVVRLSSGATLLQAFLCAACLHSRNVFSLEPHTLAAALSIEREQVFREVLWPLGEEAAVTQAGQRILVRHRAIAEVAMELAAEWGEDIGEIYYRTIRGAIEARQAGTYVPDLGSVINLPRELAGQGAVAVRAAEAPVDAEPERMSCRISMASVLRRVGRPVEAERTAYETYVERASFFDRRSSLRVLMHEWGFCAGLANRNLANAYLTLLSVSDCPGGEADPMQGSTHSAEEALVGLAEALSALWRADPQGWISDGEAAVSEIRGALRDVEPQLEHIDRMIGDLDELARNLVTGIKWEGDETVATLPEGGHLQFDQLKNILEHHPSEVEPA